MKKIHYMQILFRFLLALIISPFIYGNINVSEDETQKLSIGFLKNPYSLNFIEAFNHSEMHIQSALYSGILTLNPNTLQPDVGLAISWFINDNYDEYTFNLRDGVKFSDGTLMTAYDVKASWMRSIQAKNAFIYLFELIQGVSAYTAGEGSMDDIQIIVINESVLKVVLKEPAPYFLSTITHPAFSVTSQSQLEKEDWTGDAKNIVFSGPFVVKEKNEEHLILKKNDYFWDKESIYFDEIDINFYKNEDKYKVIQDINDNKVQWATFYTAPQTEDDVALRDRDWLIVHPIFGTNYLFFGDTQKKPWNNENIRTAIKLLLPLRKYLNEEYSFPASSLVPPIAGTYTPDIPFPNQDRQLALEMLKDEGYPKGVGLGEIVLLVAEFDDGSHKDIYDMIKESLESSLDISVTFKVVPARDYQTHIREGGFTLASTSWIGDFADPAAFLQIWAAPNAYLGHNYNNEEYQKIITESNLSIGQERINRLIAAENMLINSTVVIPVSRIITANVVRNDLLYGWSMNILDVHLLGSLYKEEVRAIPRMTRFEWKKKQDNSTQDYITDDTSIMNTTYVQE